MQIFRGGLIRTMDLARPVAEALAVDADRIAAVGCEHAVRAMADEGATVIELDGGCLCPGFIDAHHHVSFGALFAGRDRLGGAEQTTVGEILARLRGAALATPPGQWVLAVGYDELGLRERRPPTRAELDAACPDHPVLALHFSVHEGVANSRAFHAAGLTDSSADRPRGRIARDWRGRPTGLLVEEAASRMLCLAMDECIALDPSAYGRSLLHYQEQLFARGIVRVFDPGVHPALEAALKQAHQAGALRVSLHLMVVGRDGMFSDPSDRLDGPTTGTGSPGLRIGPLKVFMDGGKQIGLRMGVAQLLRSLVSSVHHDLRTRSLDAIRVGNELSLRPGSDGKLHGGWLFYETKQARRLFERAEERGFSVAVHAIGNEAISRALDALPPSPSGRAAGVGPHRIEHFLITEPGQVERAAERGLAVVVQPAFVPLVASRVQPSGFPPPERLLPLRELLDAGLCVAGSSDAPVDDFSPLRAMWCATERRLPSGAVYGAEQRILPEEALELYTRQAALAGGVETECGTLVRGKRADLVWLSEDPVRPGALAPPGPRVRGTWVGGEQVYEAELDESRR